MHMSPRRRRGKIGDAQFVLSLTNQFLRGMYRLGVGPAIQDAAGNLMDQDEDGTGGETIDDQYAGTVNYDAPLWSDPMRRTSCRDCATLPAV